MNEAVTKRFLLYFRLMLLAWILIANAIIHVTGMEYSWLIFLSNIMMFTLEGDVKDRFWTVELGGLVGLVLTVVALLSITALTPVLGGLPGLLLPLAVVSAMGVDGGSLFQYIGHIIHFWTHRRKLHFRRIGYRYGQSKRKKKPQKRKA